MDGKPSFKQSRLLGLPDPNKAMNAVEGKTCESANTEIEQVVRQKRKELETWKRGPYTRYSPKERLEMAR